MRVKQRHRLFGKEPTKPGRRGAPESEQRVIKSFFSFFFVPVRVVPSARGL